jgi:hypothetical protein
MNIMKTYSFEQALELWNKLPQHKRNNIRSIAVRRLCWQGWGEIGSIDINQEIHDMCNEYEGDFESIMMEYLEDFLRGYKSLA